MRRFLNDLIVFDTAKGIRFVAEIGGDGFRRWLRLGKNLGGFKGGECWLVGPEMGNFGELRQGKGSRFHRGFRRISGVLGKPGFHFRDRCEIRHVRYDNVGVGRGGDIHLGRRCSDFILNRNCRRFGWRFEQVGNGDFTSPEGGKYGWFGLPALELGGQLAKVAGGDAAVRARSHGRVRRIRHFPRISAPGRLRLNWQKAVQQYSPPMPAKTGKPLKMLKSSRNASFHGPCAGNMVNGRLTAHESVRSCAFTLPTPSPILGAVRRPEE